MDRETLTSLDRSEEEGLIVLTQVMQVQTMDHRSQTKASYKTAFIHSEKINQ